MSATCCAPSRGGRPAAFVTDWRQRNVTFFSALEVERNVMFIILTLIVLVAALNIISGLIMLVKDKGHDIAILRTDGRDPRRDHADLPDHRGQHRLCRHAGRVCPRADCLSEYRKHPAVRVLADHDRNCFDRTLYFLSKLPAEIDSGETLTVLVMALVLSLLATLYPAWRAARLDPVEALRYE